MFSICAILLSFFPFFESPTDSVDIYVTNSLKSTTISSMYYLINGDFVLNEVPMQIPLSPDSTMMIKFPSLYFDRIIFEGDDKSIFYIGHYPASSNGDTLEVSLANKEFGLMFDRVYGSYPVAFGNSSMVPLVSISVPNDSSFEENLLRGRMLLPDEVLCLWVDSGTIIEAFALDVGGNLSSALIGVASPIDTVYLFTPSHFYHNGNVFGFQDGIPGSMIVNCLPNQEIVLVEAFDLDGYFVSGIDCSPAPLSTWDQVFCPHSTPLSYILCTDSEGRTYSLIEPDQDTGEYLIDLLSLDFGFGFPE